MTCRLGGRFRIGTDSVEGRFGWIPSSPAGGNVAVFNSLCGRFDPRVYRNGVRIRTDSVEGRIRVDSGGFLDPGNGIR